MEKWYLFSVWGDQGNRNGCVEDFDNETAADNGIFNLLKDHPDATWMLVKGEEVRRG